MCWLLCFQKKKNTLYLYGDLQTIVVSSSIIAVFEVYNVINTRVFILLSIYSAMVLSVVWMSPLDHSSNVVPLFVFIEIREEERKILERAGYFQSITVGVAPIVVVIASVVTFSVHMILGYDLTAAQVSC